jgi:hypothetical protein
LTAACVWQDVVVVLVGQVSVTVGAAGTVNVALAVTLAPHEEVAVHVTVAVPPHADGAAVLLFVTDTLHPPLFVTPVNQVAYAAFTAACVWQDVVVVLDGAVNVTVVALGTVNVALAVTLAPHEEVAVHVTVAVPPHADGAAVLLFVTDTLHPPLFVTPVNQVAYAASTCACVWQDVVVVLDGAVNVTVVTLGTVNVALHVVVVGAQLLV